MKNGKSNLIRDLIELIVVIAVWGILFYGFLILIKTCATETVRHAEKKSAEAAVVSEEAILTALRYADGQTDDGATQTALKVYTEGTGTPPPSWFRPGEEMAVEWESEEWLAVGEQSSAQEQPTAHPPEGIDPGGMDYNICSTLWGWDGHSCEVWEMDLFSRIFYLEFWQPNLTLCEAGCDAMLQLWDLNGGTLFDTLSAITESGAYAFSTYPAVWKTEYDAEGLAWCRAYCEERFTMGPAWTAQYFRKGQYHDWGQWSPIPAYEIDGIYFSTAKK